MGKASEQDAKRNAEHKSVQDDNEKCQTIAKGSVPRCLEITQKGIRTSGEFAQMMAAMMSDLVEGTITPQVGNAVTNAGGKLLKVVEMQMQYGTTCADGKSKNLTLVSPSL